LIILIILREEYKLRSSSGSSFITDINPLSQRWCHYRRHSVQSKILFICFLKHPHIEKCFKCYLSRTSLRVRHTLSRQTKKKKRNSVALVRKLTKPIERPPLLGEVSANFCGQRVSRDQPNGSPWPLISIF
jgi:hypothetical protein